MRFSRTPARKRGLFGYRGGWMALAILLLAGGAAAWYFINGAAQAQIDGQAETQITTTTVRRGDLSLSTSGSGVLTAGQVVDLSFSTAGTVVELNVKIGDQVQAGDVLARLGASTTLQAALAAAKLELLQAQQELAALPEQAGLTLAQAYQNYVKAQETYQEAAFKIERMAYARCSQEVNTRNAATLARAQEKLAALDPAEYGSDLWIATNDALIAAQANYDVCIAYSVDEKTAAQATRDVAAAALDQAETTYNTLKDAAGIDPDSLAVAEARLEKAQAQLAKAEEDLEGITLVAPFDGKITTLAAGEGAIVGTDRYITISDVSRPVITVSVDETDLDMFVLGAAAVITFDALPDRVFSGQVEQVNPALVSSGQYRVIQGVVALDEASARAVQTLPLGLNASVTIVSEEVKDALLVPMTALKDLGDGQYAVMLMSSAGQLEQQMVTVGLQDASFAEITGGLQEGDVVSTGLKQAVGSSNRAEEEELFAPMPLNDGMLPPDGGGGMMAPP